MLLMSPESRISHGLPTIAQQKLGKTLPGVTNLNFCCDIWMSGLGGVNNMKAWFHPVLHQQLVVVVDGGADFTNFEPLSTN